MQQLSASTLSEARLLETQFKLAGQEASFASERENWCAGQGQKLKLSAVYPSGQDLGAKERGEHPDALGRTEQSSSSLPGLFGGLHSALGAGQGLPRSFL